MKNEDPGERLPPRLPSAPIRLGAIAAVITAVAVSWATPDGNLVVTMVPALVVGLTVFGIASWWVRRGGPE